MAKLILCPCGVAALAAAECVALGPPIGSSQAGPGGDPRQLLHPRRSWLSLVAWVLLVDWSPMCAGPWPTPAGSLHQGCPTGVNAGEPGVEGRGRFRPALDLLGGLAAPM